MTPLALVELLATVDSGIGLIVQITDEKITERWPVLRRLKQQ
jgi:hypothetical protein